MSSVQGAPVALPLGMWNLPWCSGHSISSPSMKPSARLACPCVQVSWVAKILPARLYRQTGSAPRLTSRVPSSGTSEITATLIQFSFMSLEWIDETVGNEGAVEDAELLTELEPAVFDHELVAVLARVEHAGELVLQGLEGEVAGADLEDLALPAEHADAAHQAAHVAGRVDGGPADGSHPVQEVAPAFAKPGGKRQAAIEVFAWDDLVQAGVSEKLGPLLEPLLVEAGRVVRVELLEGQPKLSGAQGEVALGLGQLAIP